ncbi:tetraacyldisaccharide 4'-kinase [soil metagenome]
MLIIRYLLLPLSFIYWIITKFRNHLYNIGYKRSFSFETMVINVGNLSVGGTGKSPMIEYIIRLLKMDYKLATLSRGYGRRSSGFKIADENSTSRSIGDEPRQFYLKFKHKIAVCVGEERAIAIPEILFNIPDTDIILLDDAFQHRSVKADLNILLSDYNNLFYKDLLLPTGNLRESREGASRADILVITKCPPKIELLEMEKIKINCRKYLKEKTPVYFSGIEYLTPIKVFDNSEFQFSRNVILFSGIGKSLYLENYVKNQFNLLNHIKFADHHRYTFTDFKKLKGALEKTKFQNACLLTTEKDMVKINEEELAGIFNQLPIFYLPIKTKFISEAGQFQEQIFNKITEKQKVL